MKILFASAEVVPFAKTGGLADVAGALPKTLAAMGHDVRIVMPRYRCIDGSKYGLRQIVAPFDIPHGRDTIQVSLEQSDAIEGVATYFIRNDYLYNRDVLYGHQDDDHRFTAFCRGIMELCPKLGWAPDVLHCNDWHTGLVPVYLKTLYADHSEFAHTKSLFTIHNLAYQGTFPPAVMELAGLPWKLFTWDKLAHQNIFNFMKAGLIYADSLSTVSAAYAREIRTEEYGAGLEGVLEYRKDDLYGILNGIDYEVWNPRTDKHLNATFSPEAPAGKARCKSALQKTMRLPVENDIPLFGLISRLSSQKGFDLLEKALPPLLNARQFQLVILGTGDAHYHKMLTALAKKHRDKLAITLKFDNTLAHRIYAGSDFFLMPSHYEPCGLGQMISLAYGTIPVVRATGGLADSITEYHAQRGKGNGFRFEKYTVEAFRKALLRALECYADQDNRAKIIQNAFASDFSWPTAAKHYVKIYKKK